MQVLKQVFPLADINGNPDITLEAGDWHDNPQNLIFPGKTDTCNITYIRVNNTKTVDFLLCIVPLYLL